MSEWIDEVVTAPRAARLKGVAVSSIRAARIRALQQEFADLPLSTEEFLREKHEEMMGDKEGAAEHEKHAGHERNARLKRG